MFCEQCGNEIVKGDKYCSDCGASIEEAVEKQVDKSAGNYNLNAPPVKEQSNTTLPIPQKSSNAFRDLNIPKPPGNSSPSFERVTVALSGSPPAGITIEDILLAKNKSVSTLNVIRSMFNSWLGFFKKPTLRNIVLIGAAVVFFAIWVWTKYVPGPYIFMMPPGIASIFAILFATLNNIPARVLHFSALVTLASTFLPGLMKGNLASMAAPVKNSAALIKQIISYKNNKTLYSAVTSCGVALFISNYLMRNCSINKYFVCLTLGLAILLSSSGMINATFPKLCGAIFNDVLRLLKIRDKLSKYITAITIGLGLGFILSIVPSLLRGLTGDYGAYMLGSLVMVAGIVLMVIKPGSSAGKKNDTTSV